MTPPTMRQHASYAVNRKIIRKVCSPGRKSGHQTSRAADCERLNTSGGIPQSLLRGQPAVDDKPCSGHETGVIGRKKDNTLGNVVGDTQTANRMLDKGVKPLAAAWTDSQQRAVDLLMSQWP